MLLILGELREMCVELWQGIDNDKVGVCVRLDQGEASKVVVGIVGFEVLGIVTDAVDEFPFECRKDD